MAILMTEMEMLILFMLTKSQRAPFLKALQPQPERSERKFRNMGSVFLLTSLLYEVSVLTMLRA